MLYSQVVGQRLNLTSASFRAFRFAKRCPGGRGGGPPFGMVFASIPAHPSRPLAQTLRCAPLARVVDGTFPSFVGADAHIGPLLGTTCGASVGRGDLTPPRTPPVHPVGGGLRPAPPERSVFAPISLFPEYLSHRVGADLCVRPRMGPAKNRPRADTAVGPYKTSINFGKTGRGQSPAPA